VATETPLRFPPMPSGKKSKQARRAAASAPPPVRSTGQRGRQADPKVLAIAGGVIAVVVVAVVLALVFTGGSSGGKLPSGTPTVGNCSTNGLPGCSEVASLFKGIPQQGLYLGSPFAKSQMTIYIDLQCPFCQNYETTVMPTLIKKYVRTNKVRIKVLPWAFIGPDSTRGQKAMFAAAQQNKAWNFAEVLYLNQRTENTGWLNDSMVAQAAASVDGLNVQKLWSARNSGAISKQIADVAAQAQINNVSGTPTVFVGKSGSKQKLVGSPGSVPDLAQTEAAIDAAQ
jgi:protein-disulfide isomerase